MDIILIRHGESEDNIKRVLSNDDALLTQNGKKQIEMIKPLVAELDFKDVYISPLKRTIQTSEILGINGSLESRVREIDFGIFKGLGYEEFMRVYPEEGKKWISDIKNYQIPNGESLKMTYQRVVDFLENIIKNGENSLVITHEGIIKLAFSWVFDSDEYFNKFMAANGSINIISIDKDYKFIKKLNARG
ncbi:histidine phosphatase family protein [Soehngenia saccharolytica]|nr:histidine phosphatase family protein [Soehngenia saccharolytica]HOK62695.1 histidine phosphatase family protein [Soehngenia sp.]